MREGSAGEDIKSAVLILRKGLLRLDQFGSSWFVGIAADFQQLAKISLAGIVISAEFGGPRCAVERAEASRFLC